jgi:hypothetical protein
VHLDLTVIQVHLELQGPQDLRVTSGVLALRDSQGRLEHRDQPEGREIPETQEVQDLKDSKDHLDQVEHLETLVQRESLDSLELQDHKALRVHRARAGSPDPWVLRECLEPRVHWVALDQLGSRGYQEWLVNQE